MFRKMLGVFTAVAAAVLLVGVAWASGDGARDDSSSGSVAASAAADVSSSVSLASSASDTSVDDRTSTSIDDSSTSAGVDADTRTSISLVGTSSTSTTLDSTTSTSMDDRSTSSTSSTVDDHSTVPITTEPRSYDVDGAGSVSIQVVAGKLVLLHAEAASGWALNVDKADARDIKMEFENGDSDAEFEAKIRDGELRVEIERD